MEEKDPVPGDYVVGYGRPPKHSQFKAKNAGGSGNHNQSVKGGGIADLLNKPIKVKIRGKERRMHPFEATLRGMAMASLRGEPRAMKFMFHAMVKAGVFETPEQGRAGVDQPSSMPAPVFDQMLELCGRQPWPRKLYRDMLAEYRATRTPEEAEEDEIYETDLYREDYHGIIK